MPTYLIARSPRLGGDVSVAPSKNAALPLLAAALLTDERVSIERVPDLSDIEAMCEILASAGAQVRRANGGVTVCGGPSGSPESAREAVGKMRASVLLLGPLLARLKNARIALPGGCAIGQRPVDLHVKGFEKMGARGAIEGGCLTMTGELTGANIYLDFPSVGATENLLMGAALAKGETRIENAAKEPEIVNLADMLRGMGADIRGAGTGSIRVMGVKRLHGTAFMPIPDRIEAGTFLCAASVTQGSLLLKN